MTDPAPAAPLLDARHVSRRFGDFTAVDDVSLAVGAGEIVGLVGANGAGKTTFIRLLLGLLPASEGAVSMFGGPPSRRSRRRLGYVPQGLGLYRDMTVAENAAFQAAAFGFRADDIDLPPDLVASSDRLVGSIGLGRQRQLAFACVLAHQPDALVLDEPTSGVDPLARARLWDAVRTEVEGGVGVLVTTHYMEEAQQCDRLVLMASGRIAAAGTVEEITAGRTVAEVSAPSWSEAFAVLDADGYPVMLDGRRIRVPLHDAITADDVGRVLDARGIRASVRTAPASLDEAMVLVSRDGVDDRGR
jgi:ABC-2 type transport system ATP-binding protein